MLEKVHLKLNLARSTKLPEPSVVRLAPQFHALGFAHIPRQDSLFGETDHHLDLSLSMCPTLAILKWNCRACSANYDHTSVKAC